jgi:MFS family permease
MLAPLAHAGYRRLVGGSVFSWAAQWIQQASMGWVAYEITGSEAMLGVVLAVRAVPMLLLAPLSGVAADRYERRRLIFASQAFAAAVALLFGAALALLDVGLWTLFVFSALMGAANVADRPARLSAAFELVPRGLAAQAVAINSMLASLMRMGGPAAAGYLIVWAGAAGSFFVQALLHAASGLAVLAVFFPPRPAPAAGGSARADLIDGLRFAMQERSTRTLFLTGACQFVLAFPAVWTLYPIFAKDEFQVGADGFGLLVTSAGAGAIGGALLAGALARVARQEAVQLAGVLLFCGSLAGVALTTSFETALAFSALAGAGEMLFTSSNMAALQLSAPAHLRGRIASLIMFYPALIAAGGLIAGPLAALLGVRAASLVLAGAAAAAAVALYARAGLRPPGGRP